METSLRFDSNGKSLRLFAKEKFSNDDNYVLTVSGSLDTKDGRVESRAYVRKKFFPEAVLSRVDMGLSYATTADDVKYGIAGKKSFELTDDGLTTLDVKGGVAGGLVPQVPSRRHLCQAPCSPLCLLGPRVDRE